MQPLNADGHPSDTLVPRSLLAGRPLWSTPVSLLLGLRSGLACHVAHVHNKRGAISSPAFVGVGPHLGVKQTQFVVYFSSKFATTTVITNPGVSPPTAPWMLLYLRYLGILSLWEGAVGRHFGPCGTVAPASRLTSRHSKAQVPIIAGV